MKATLNKGMVLMLSFFISLPLLAQGPPEDKADFKAEKIPMAKSNPKAPLISDSYIFIIKDEVVPSFLSKMAKEKRQFSNRDDKAKAFDAHEREARQALMKIAKDRFGIPPGQVDEVYTGSITGFTVKKMDKAQAEGLKRKAKEAPELLAMGEDFEMTINVAAIREMSEEEAATMPLAQSPSWGTNYTGWTDKTNSPYWAWILDTGIDLDHPDLNVKTGYGKSCVSYTSSADDDHGHGSHVAGIVAAKNNSAGTLGVAAGAWVVPVKVCTSGGACSWSDILEGLQHVSRYSISGDVLNMSLGKTPPSWWDEIWNNTPAKAEREIKDLAASGVHMVFAAGNDNALANTKSPARISGTRMYTVSAMDWNYNIASFSNYGNPPVDYAAPGVSIRSCYKNGGYAYMDGTSMAAPYVAGILLSNNGSIGSTRTLNTDKDSSKDRVAKR